MLLMLGDGTFPPELSLKVKLAISLSVNYKNHNVHENNINSVNTRFCIRFP